MRTGIEVVITGLTRNQFVGNSGTWVRIPPRPPNKNLKVDRNLEVFALYFGFKETLCLCGFRNASCKSAADNVFSLSAALFLRRICPKISVSIKNETVKFYPDLSCQLFTLSCQQFDFSCQRCDYALYINIYFF